MKISIVIPTHRTSYSAIARIMECASLDSDKFEVVVRDNSEDDGKKALLSNIDSPALRRHIVSNRGGAENMAEALRLATGDFVFFLADDDWISTRGLLQLHSLAKETGGDGSVACLTGVYLIESSNGVGFVKYSNLDSPDPVTRLSAYFAANAPNVLYYCAVRRELANFAFALLDGLPYKFSYHDQLISMLYLTAGRTLQIDRPIYFYDLGEWETLGGTLKRDRLMYVGSGLPAEIDRLHWLLCGLEGGLLLHSQSLAGKMLYDRQKLSDLWFANMFARFKYQNRESGFEVGPINSATAKLKEKWVSEPSVNLHELLLDVTDVLNLADAEGARRYFDFWSRL